MYANRPRVIVAFNDFGLYIFVGNEPKRNVTGKIHQILGKGEQKARISRVSGENTRTYTIKPVGEALYDEVVRQVQENQRQ